MPSIMVYTEETFYYTDGIRVVAREEYMRPDVTELSFYRKEGFWFGFDRLNRYRKFWDMSK